ncbi:MULTISPECIES: 50S ribosomal protein L3 N(5)-glutamine methyltransferase [Thioalkalivibrio]|uniref:Ribosomal protein uL3 glutamine methyltransferase n=1 Tax=Thioalkalivibrio halophilus TaxID=252474 RepID=A0A1V3A128_9GAMM|nr:MULTISPECIES: 50S ribosomal protein L3 N(5)-glutamine methyltransferase [Thioalkalivibrio]OOC11009.1 ribosomal protein L3 N(5)-glutamine methyltransferase [Thioalkalivibrio halophilus]PYG02635.1 [LSU ribosomal protein L3P]-glutamine N5-methyltransferase [Thioalkalivibrio sp. ALE21]
MEPGTGLLTLRDFIRYGASQFRAAGLSFGHGTDNAFDEAAWLTLHALHLPLDLEAHWWDSRLTEAERERVEGLLRERIQSRKPAAYLAREAWFAGLPFHVDERVLVPRSPFAEVIESGFEPWVDPDAVERVLDLGTGAGCIGIAVALVLPQARVDLADISPDALAVARDNVARYQLEDRVRLVESDVFEGLGPEDRYDLIVTNPPYVDARDMAELPDEYRHEPELGLAAGEDGLDIVRRILAGARRHLTDEGVLMVEVGNSQEAVEDAFHDIPMVWLDFEAGGHGVFVVRAEDLPAD